MNYNIKYILQQRTDKGLVNAFYANAKGKDSILMGEYDKAMRFNTIGDAMRESARLSKENNGLYFQAVEICDTSKN